jgi:hypothetical protein
MNLQRINDYFDCLLARMEEGAHIPCVKFYGTKPHHCHENADAYAASRPDEHTVRGWLVTPTPTPGIHMLHAHSVVRRPDNQLIDVSPCDADRAGLLFLEHQGSSGDYEFLMVNCAQWLHPLPSDWRLVDFTRILSPLLNERRDSVAERARPARHREATP